MRPKRPKSGLKSGLSYIRVVRFSYVFLYPPAACESDHHICRFEALHLTAMASQDSQGLLQESPDEDTLVRDEGGAGLGRARGEGGAARGHDEGEADRGREADLGSRHEFGAELGCERAQGKADDHLPDENGVDDISQTLFDETLAGPPSEHLARDKRDDDSQLGSVVPPIIDMGRFVEDCDLELQDRAIANFAVARNLPTSEVQLATVEASPEGLTFWAWQGLDKQKMLGSRHPLSQRFGRQIEHDIKAKGIFKDLDEPLKLEFKSTWAVKKQLDFVSERKDTLSRHTYVCRCLVVLNLSVVRVA